MATPVPYKNGNGNAPSIPTVVAVLALVATGISFIWTNSRGDVLQTKTELETQIVALTKELNKYVTEKEHLAYKSDIQARIARDEQDINKMFNNSVTTDRFITHQTSEDRRSDRIDRDIKDLRDAMVNYVRREEHVKDLAQLNERISGIRDTTLSQFSRTEATIAEVQRVITGATTIGDQLKAIQKRQDDLDGYLRTHKSSVN